jgi:hypothetical protein
MSRKGPSQKLPSRSKLPGSGRLPSASRMTTSVAPVVSHSRKTPSPALIEVGVMRKKSMETGSTAATSSVSVTGPSSPSAISVKIVSSVRVTVISSPSRWISAGSATSSSPASSRMRVACSAVKVSVAGVPMTTTSPSSAKEVMRTVRSSGVVLTSTCAVTC